MISERQHLVENKTLFISCVIPVYNEVNILNDFISAINKVLTTLTNTYEIIIVDDGSCDETLNELEQLSLSYPIKILSLSRNFGKEIALSAGLEHSTGDVTIFIDADFQHPLELIEVFIKKWADGFDMVYGIRKERHLETFFKRGLTNFFYWLMQKITKVKIPSHAGDFRLLDKKMIAAIKIFPERTRFMKGLYAWVGFKSVGVPFNVQTRASGLSTWHFSRLTELAITGITSFSDVPLRIWSWIGFSISLLSLFYALYIILTTIIYGTDLPGFPTLIVAIMFLGGIQLLSIGILGEYIARIFTEVKQRPKYLLRFKKGFEDDL